MLNYVNDALRLDVRCVIQVWLRVIKLPDFFIGIARWGSSLVFVQAIALIRMMCCIASAAEEPLYHTNRKPVKYSYIYKQETNR